MPNVRELIDIFAVYSKISSFRNRFLKMCPRMLASLASFLTAWWGKVLWYHRGKVSYIWEEYLPLIFGKKWYYILYQYYYLNNGTLRNGCSPTEDSRACYLGNPHHYYIQLGSKLRASKLIKHYYMGRYENVPDFKA